MEGAQLELLIIAAIVFVLMIVLALLKHTARKSGLHLLGRKGRRVLRK